MTSAWADMTWSTVTSRAVLFFLMWWALAEGSASSWQIGVPAVCVAVFASVTLVPPAPLVWLEFLWFVPFFLWRSFLGGVDVAWRAFHPGMPIAPALIEYAVRLPRGLPRVFMANTVSLLPGTLCASIDQNVLTVHVLTHRKGFVDELEAVERRIARMFGASLKLS